jgi:CheY-like chemotaxis protein
MLKLERLFLISALKLKDKVEHMDDMQMSLFERDLNAFLSDWPKRKRTIKSSMKIRNNQLLSRELTAVSVMLCVIFAYDISKECRIDNLDEMPYDEIEKKVHFIVETVSMLAIDIQIALSNKSTVGNNITKANENDIKTILAVDDVPLFLKNLKTILKDMPYKVVCVTSAKDALRFLENHKPDLFFLDIEMPDMNGYQLAEKIISGEQNAPIIFMSGNSSSDDVEKALANGGSDYIIKTMQKEYIIEKIKRYI